jgi:transcriptional regulator with XRE-family HTH domain
MDWQSANVAGMLERTSSNLAANIKRLRERRDLTQQQLAELSGVPRPTIANLESGTANPTLLVLLKVADSLAASIEELVGGGGLAMTVHRARTLPERKRARATLRQLIPDGFRPAEFERLELAPRGKLGARPESPGSREVLACESGEIDLIAAGETLRLGAGDVVALGADQQRDYVNRGRGTAVAYRLVATAGAAG